MNGQYSIKSINTFNRIYTRYKAEEEKLVKLKRDSDHYSSKKEKYQEELTESKTREAKVESELESLKKKAENFCPASSITRNRRRPEAIFKELEGLEKDLQKQKENLENVNVVMRKLKKSKKLYHAKKLKVSKGGQSCKNMVTQKVATGHWSSAW